MNLVFVVAFMAIYLAVGVRSASVAYSISNDKLMVKGTVDVNLNIPIEEVWDGLSKSKKKLKDNDILDNHVFVALTLIGKKHIRSWSSTMSPSKLRTCLFFESQLQPSRLVKEEIQYNSKSDLSSSL